MEDFMKQVLYFVLSIVALLVLMCIGYSGLSHILVETLPTVGIIDSVAAPFYFGWPTLSWSFWSYIPLLILTLFCLVNFGGKGIKILFFVILILVIVLDVLVLFFPDVISNGIGA